MELLYTNYNNVFRYNNHITFKTIDKFAILDNSKKRLSKLSFLNIITIDKFTILDIISKK